LVIDVLFPTVGVNVKSISSALRLPIGALKARVNAVVVAVELPSAITLFNVTEILGVTKLIATVFGDPLMVYPGFATATVKLPPLVKPEIGKV